jgi:hypothetical protein
MEIRRGRGFKIALPLPLALFLGVSDFLEDIAFFIPNVYHVGERKKMSPAAIKQIVKTTAVFFREIALNTEPFDLADIEIKDGSGGFSFKCLLK